jgi:endonuclease-3 related protein
MHPEKLYNDLMKKYGNLNWWPMDKDYHEKNKSDPRFEVILGAILTQNTAWSNVEKAIDNLKKSEKLDINSINNIENEKLKNLIRPSGFFNQKATRLKYISKILKNKYNSNLDNFFKKDKDEIREELLEMNGIGPETADSIVLYAANKPIFVVDAYTKRLCKRFPLKTKITYDEIQKYFQKNLEENFDKKELTKIYKNLHAMIVILAKEYCKKRPICENCPLKKDCNYPKENLI